MELQDIPRFMDDPGRMQCIRESHGLKRGQPSQTTAYLAEVMIKWAIKTKITDDWKYCYEGLSSMVKYIRSRPWKID